MASYPLTLHFDLWSTPHKMIVKDAKGSTYMQMSRSLTLKHQIEVATYQNQQQTYKIAAEGLLSRHPVHGIWNQQGQMISTIERYSYKVYDGRNLLFQVGKEDDPRSQPIRYLIFAMMMIGFLLIYANPIGPVIMFSLALILTALIGSITCASGQLINPPIYTVKRPDGRRVMQVAMIPELTLHHSQFSIKLIDSVSPTEEHSALFAILLKILYEHRGR
jgi:hypothetical protein